MSIERKDPLRRVYRLDPFLQTHLQTIQPQTATISASIDKSLSRQNSLGSVSKAEVQIDIVYC